jgi:Glycosyl hydrolase family 12
VRSAVAIASALALAASIALIPAAASASGGPALGQPVTAGPVAPSMGQNVQKDCGLTDWISQEASGGVWTLSRANAFDTSGQTLCITAHHGVGFTVDNNLRYTGLWQAYPFTGVGCAYSLCTHGTDLPKQVRRLPYWANTSFSWRPNGAPGSWNASYDIWFDTRDQITTEDNGAELMIWLKPNTAVNGIFHMVRVGHQTYWWTWWNTCDSSGICWHYIQFRFLHTVAGVRNLWLMPFIRFLEARGLMKPSWWLTSIHAGYELVSGGKGLETTWFNAHV